MRANAFMVLVLACGLGGIPACSGSTVPPGAGDTGDTGIADDALPFGDPDPMEDPGNGPDAGAEFGTDPSVSDEPDGEDDAAIAGDEAPGDEAWTELDTGPIGDATDDVDTVTPPTGTWYVDAAARGGNNGTSWTNAFTQLQSALDVAVAGEEIRVAQGRYLPTLGRVAGDNRSRSFVLKAGVRILGGHGGLLNKVRNPALYKTILSGDLDRNDLDKDGNTIAETWEDIVGDNAYSVVVCNGLDDTTVLDGFVVTGGFADHPENSELQAGAGIRIIGGAPILRNLTVTGNAAKYYRHRGGGMYVEGGGPRVEDSTFSGNFAYSGGGIGLYTGSHATIRGCTLQDNFARTLGGALLLWEGDLVLENVLAQRNVARNEGGVLYANSAKTILVTGSTFLDNREGAVAVIASQGGAGTDLRVQNTRFAGNRGGNLSGGAMVLSSVRTELTNVLFSGNYAYGAGGAIQAYKGTLLATNVTFAANRATTEGSAVRLWDATATFRNCLFWDNGVDLVSGTPAAIYQNVFHDKGVDPGFNAALAASEAPTVEGDYRLRKSASFLVVDAGEDAFNSTRLDLDGLPRIAGSAIDLGAYELQPSKPAHPASTGTVRTARALAVRPPPAPFRTGGRPSAFAAVLGAAPGRTIRVDSRAVGAGDGSSWANAFVTLDAALSAAVAGDQVWVAAGVYVPSIRQDASQAGSETFLLPADVAVHGGFAGTETDLGQRDWLAHRTILSGDLDGDDLDADGDSVAQAVQDLVGTNAGHVVTVSGGTGSLDGLVITAGMAASVVIGWGATTQGNGGGIWVKDSPALALQDIVFSGNYGQHGGAVYALYRSSLTFRNVTFTGNAAGYGAACYLEMDTTATFDGSWFQDNLSEGGGTLYAQDYAEVRVNGSTLDGNTASQSEGLGGAVALAYDGRGDIQDSSILRNVAAGASAAYAFEHSYLKMVGVEVRGNRSAGSGMGGALGVLDSHADLVNTLISGNTSVGSGGGLTMYGPSDFDPPTVTLDQVTLAGNRSDLGSGISNGASQSNGILTARNSLIVDAVWTRGGVFERVSCGTGDPMFVAPGAAGSAPTVDGDYHLKAGSPAVNAGSNALVPAGITTDLDGLPRVVGGTVDQGAYERQ